MTGNVQKQLITGLQKVSLARWETQFEHAVTGMPETWCVLVNGQRPGEFMLNAKIASNSNLFATWKQYGRGWKVTALDWRVHG